MGELEDKKKKLGIKSMDYVEQKGLYNDFVNVGGKIVELKGGKDKVNAKLEDWIKRKEDEQRREQALEEKRREEDLERKKAQAEQAERDKKKQQAANAQKAAQAKQINPFEEITQQVAKKIAKPKEPHPMQDYFSRFAAKLVCVIYGVMTLFGRRFSRSFLDLNYLEFQNSLMDSRQILTSILYQNKDTSIEIRHRLAQTGFPYYYELLYRFDQLYEEEFFTMIKSLASEKEPVFKAKPFFLKLFKKILLLNRYQPSLYNAIEKALTQEKMLRSLDEGTVSQNMKKLHKHYQLVFFSFYPKLTNLIDYYYKDELVSGRKVAFRDFLGIGESDTIGYLTKFWQDEEEQERLKKEEEERKKKLEEERKLQEAAQDTGGGAPVSEEEIEELLTRLPENVQYGIVMIRQNVIFRDILQYYYDKKDSRMVFPMNDKVFLAYSLIEFFDKEFSFLFVSSGVQYNIFSDQGARRDTKSVLKDLYFRIDDIIYKRLNEYIKILVEIRKVNTNTYMQPKEQYTRLQQLSLQRGQISRNIRVQCGQLIEDFVKQLQIIIEDYDNEKRIVQNPEETMTFDVRILGQRMSQNQKIINVFRNAFYFSSALRHLIINGELGGSTSTLNHPVFLKIEVSEISPEDENESKFEV